MKRKLLAVAVIGILFSTACEKDEGLNPGNTLQKTDSPEKILCRDCGGSGWDFGGSDSGDGTNGFRYVPTDTLSLQAPLNPSSPAPLSPVKSLPVRKKK